MLTGYMYVYCVCCYVLLAFFFFSLSSLSVFSVIWTVVSELNVMMYGNNNSIVRSSVVIKSLIEEQ